jgi:hypothetical protein
MRKFGLSAVLVVLAISLLLSSVEAATQEEIKVAIDKGLTWLVAQQNPDGSWGDEYQVTKTAFAVLKLESHAMDVQYGYGLSSPLDPSYPYADAIERGLKYLFANAYTTNITMQPAGNPDTNGNGIGVYFDSGKNRPIYETGIVMMALQASGFPDRVVNVPGSVVNGWTYRDVMQDAVDYYAWAQNEAGTGRGGWRYTPNYENSDNSNSQWPVLGLAMAETWGVIIPPFVRSELNIWIDYIQNDANGGSGYTAPNEWVNVAKTGALLIEQAFYGDTIASQRTRDAIEYISKNWNVPSDGQGIAMNKGNYYAMYAVMKGFEMLGVQYISPLNDPSGLDWFADYADWLVSHQNPDGSWSPDRWGDKILNTEWALLILQRVAPPPLFAPLESLEELLEKQAVLLERFAEILEGQEEPSIEQLRSFEDLLTRQAGRLKSFEDLLQSKLKGLSPGRLFEFLKSLEGLLKAQCKLLGRFGGLLVRLGAIPPELLSSFEGLIQKQAELLEGFGNLLRDALGVLPPLQMTELIRSFEELLRIQDELLRSFEELLRGQSALTQDPPRQSSLTTAACTGVITIDDFGSIFGSSFSSFGSVTKTISTPAGLIAITLKGGTSNFYMVLGGRVYLTPGSIELDFKNLSCAVKRAEITIDDWAGVGRTQMSAFDPNGNLLTSIINSVVGQAETLSISEGMSIGSVEIEGRQTFIREIRIILG